MFGDVIFEGEYLNGKKWNGEGYNTNNEVLYELKFGKGQIMEFNSLGVVKFEGNYIDGELYETGKEFYPNRKLKYEGIFKNGEKWSGKGYDPNNNIIYELKDGKGYVIEYNDIYKIIFEGEYLYGKKNGKGKEYNYEGNLIFEGEYLNGMKNGKGKEYDNEGNLIFEGEYLYNKQRKGKNYINKRLEYEGEYLFNEKCDGKGYDENGNIIYEIKKGNGYVKDFDDDGILIFEGEFLNGKLNGKGKEYYYDGKIYFDGEYSNKKKI